MKLYRVLAIAIALFIPLMTAQCVKTIEEVGVVVADVQQMERAAQAEQEISALARAGELAANVRTALTTIG